MEEYNVEIGQVVYSRSGRDKGSHYMILKIVDGNNVLIVDGNKRKLDKPKLKKLKHLKVKPQVLVKLAEKIKAGKPVYDNEIGSQLKPFNEK